MRNAISPDYHKTLKHRPHLFLPKPACILNIVVGDPVYFAIDQRGGDVLNLFCGYTGIYTSRLYFGVFEYNGTSSYNRITTDLRIIHNNSAHAYQHIIMNGAAMNDRIMANRHIIADYGF